MSRPRQSPRFDLQMYRVTVAAHRVGRWQIGPLKGVELAAADSEHACKIVVRRLHRQEGVPPFRQFVRASLVYAGATPTPTRESA